MYPVQHRTRLIPWWVFCLPATAILLLLGASVALADVIPGPGEVAPAPADVAVLTGLPLIQLAASYVLNAVGYGLNYLAPWVSEQAKGVFILVLNLAFGVVIQLVDDGNFGWNRQTGVMFVAAMLSALQAHKVLDATGISRSLGAGRNKASQPPANTERVLVGS